MIEVGMISKSKNIAVRIEVVPLNIHVVNLFIIGGLCSAISIQMIPMAEITVQDLCWWGVNEHVQLLLNGFIFDK